MDKIAGAGDEGLTAAVTANPNPVKGLEKYGLTLRPMGLMPSAMITRIVLRRKPKEIPMEYQPFIWIFILCADLQLVYDTLDVMDEDGFSKFMAIVDEWFRTTGIPQEVTTELMEAVGETFELCNKMLPKAEAEVKAGDVVKKNALPGMDSQQTS